MKLKTQDLFFDLPEELIALHPADQRDRCRLLVVDPERKFYEEREFKDIVELIQPGDVLVFNDTRVDRARIYGKRATGGKHEVFLLSSADLINWFALAGKSRKLQPGEKLFFERGIEGEVIENMGQGKIKLAFNKPLSESVLDEIGEIPLPPYIRKKREYHSRDEEDYQTVYARFKGSKAAPTAGLHFTDELLEALRKKGVEEIFVQLYVSLGTFEPIKTEYVDEHAMHREEYFISPEAAQRINAALKDKRRIIAVGTTVVRTLESAFKETEIQSGRGSTDIYIKPGYSFKVVDSLITNFHTPGSTLLLLVASMLGYDFMMEVYLYAVENRFRFFSYGDAMFIR
jgi:S-adenosylmethionine:tRNA ribosyltransferase-isomerase